MSSPVILPAFVSLSETGGAAQPTSPFVSTTTPTIERANRLISLRAHPGLLDFLRISQEIVATATDALVDFGGWDKDQVMVLKVRAQAAKEHHTLLLTKLQSAIDAGLDEAKDATDAVLQKSAADAVDQGDFVRQQVLSRFAERDDLRAAGSY